MQFYVMPILSVIGGQRRPLLPSPGWILVVWMLVDRSRYSHSVRNNFNYD